MENENKTNDLSAVENYIKRKKDIKNQIKKNTEYIDLDSLEFEAPNVEVQQKSLINIFNSKPAYQVTCAQSGYMAKVSAMVYRDIIAITNSNLSNYENRKEIYKTMYNKITGYSAENWKPSFEEWLQITSIGDVETLFYGLYCATFQDKSTIRYQCPFCGEDEVITINNKQLIRVEDKKEMFELTNRINKEADTYEKIKEFSLVTDNKRNKKTIKLPNSKIVFSVSIPSLFKILDVLKTFDDATIAAKSVEVLNILLSTDKVALPNIENGKYSFIENKSDVSMLIDMLDIDDFSVLRDVVDTMLNDKHITYCVENQKCGNCKKTIAKIPLDIESLLFFQISEKQLL